MRNSGSYARLIQEDRASRIDKEEKDKKKEQKNDKKKYDEYEETMNRINEVNNRKNIYHKKVRALKESLMYECIMDLFNKSLGTQIPDEMNENLKKNLVTKFIKEQGVESLLGRFHTKNYLLSEYYRMTNKYTDLMLEDKKDEDSDDEDIAIDVNLDFDDDFLDDLKSDDIEDVADEIKHRVCMAIDDFVEKNTKDQDKLKDIIQDTQNTIAKKNKKEESKEDKEEMKEAYEYIAKGKMNNIQSRRKGIFESMVTNIANASFKNPALKHIYNEGAGLDVESIVENTKVIYTFLEMLNTTKMTDVNEQYITEMLDSFKK